MSLLLDVDSFQPSRFWLALGLMDIAVSIGAIVVLAWGLLLTYLAGQLAVSDVWIIVSGHWFIWAYVGVLIFASFCIRREQELAFREEYSIFYMTRRDDWA